MTMKFTQLKTHWSADEASCVIEFLDELRDSLWSVYGKDIIEMHHARCINTADESQVVHREFDDEIDF